MKEIDRMKKGLMLALVAAAGIGGAAVAAEGVALRVPRIVCDFCPQEAFENACKVVADCYCPTLAVGMTKRHFSPGAAGAHYGNDWWSLDYALIIDGAKWLDFRLAEDFVDNLLSTQCANGRVKLYGRDRFSKKHHTPYPDEEIASLPKYFETAYRVAAMSPDKSRTAKAYALIEKSLDWWFTRRQDPATGLVSAMFEETFIPNTVSGPMVYAPVDTNMEIANGCGRAAALARALGKTAAAEAYERKRREILSAVRRFSWDETDGCFYPYVLTKRERQKTLMASTFLGLGALDDADAARKRRLLALLTDDAHFNWNTYPLTTVSKKDALFQTVAGKYIGNPAWSGSVWTLTNHAVIKALKAAGEDRLAGELALKTVACFSDNYAEFVNPFTRSGEGVQRYGWTAAQFIQIVIEDIFGISYDAETGLTVRPGCGDRKMRIENLALPDGTVCAVQIDNGAVTIRRE